MGTFIMLRDRNRKLFNFDHFFGIPCRVAATDREGVKRGVGRQGVERKT
jgi:hypothetical protein